MSGWLWQGAEGRACKCEGTAAQDKHKRPARKNEPVCQYVSTTAHRPSPATSRYHLNASGFRGSPAEERTEHSSASTQQRKELPHKLHSCTHLAAATEAGHYSAPVPRTRRLERSYFVTNESPAGTPSHQQHSTTSGWLQEAWNKQGVWGRRVQRCKEGQSDLG